MTIKPFPFVGILISGLCLGAAGSEIVERRVPMSDRFLDFFESYCLKPLKTGTFPDLTHLVRVQITSEDVDFLHPRDGFSLSYTSGSCYVSDELGHFNLERDRAQLESSLEELRDTYTPDLPRDHSLEPEWSIGWMEGPTGDPRRWGIFMMFGAGFSQPLLSITYPEEGPKPPTEFAP
ncbi:MAG: hypothetical protein HWE33_16980 [Rhodobacteraceae bacterium]|uniref:hypothetical protein n=1 Tax=Celeribacter sp. HF31 TaxID=2721558 RepID=UPI001431FEBC|nr:hypothetical protein [Celeribacter sp. HF31]NIY80481.1 hypothetical protein [Celeribacter sp. HF31]NVK47985.1 hypothetical protein [Paracoccaceae bacterium]